MTILKISDKDFEPYVKSVKESGERTRSATYVNILLIALAVAVVRDYSYPKWSHLEFQSARRVTNCITSVLKGLPIIADPDSEPDKLERDYCDKELYRLRAKLPEENRNAKIDSSNQKGLTIEGPKTSPQTPKTAAESGHVVNDDPSINFILHTYENEANNRTNREYFKLPIFGVEFHENDAWVVTGVFNLSALIILSAFMRRDYLTIKGVSKLISDENKRFLVLSTQIFATPVGSEGQFAPRVRNAIFAALYYLPFGLHCLIVLHEMVGGDFEILRGLLGYPGACFETFLKIFTGALLLYFGRRCFAMHLRVDKLVRCIARPVL